MTELALIGLLLYVLYVYASESVGHLQYAFRMTVRMFAVVLVALLVLGLLIFVNFSVT